MEIPTTPSIAANRPASEHRKGGIDWPIFWISGGFFLLFLIAALVNLGWLSSVVDTAFGWATRGFGLYWQVLMLATFSVSLGIAFSKLGRVKLGGIGQVPSNSTFNWVVIIMCALLAGGGAFWAAAEPLMHFVNPPPFYGVEGKTYAAGVAALSQSFLHWGFLAWAVLGSLLSIVLMHLHYDKGLPLAPRTLFIRCLANVRSKDRSRPLPMQRRSSRLPPARLDRSVFSVCRSRMCCIPSGTCPILSPRRRSLSWRSPPSLRRRVSPVSKACALFARSMCG
jgi:hypothetical protein